MKIAIVGSRTYSENDYPLFCSFMKKYFGEEKDISFISGGGAGIDRFAEWYAKEKNIHNEVVKPDFIMYGKRAFTARKIDVAKKADVIFAMWDGWSKDTRDFVVIGKNFGKKIVKEIYEGDGYDYLIDSAFPGEI